MKGEQWNKHVQEASQGNGELLMLLEILLGYVEKKEKSRCHGRYCLFILTTIYQMSETFLPEAGSSLPSPDEYVSQKGFGI